MVPVGPATSRSQVSILEPPSRAPRIKSRLLRTESILKLRSEGRPFADRVDHYAERVLDQNDAALEAATALQRAPAS